MFSWRKEAEQTAVRWQKTLETGATRGDSQGEVDQGPLPAPLCVHFCSYSQGARALLSEQGARAVIKAPWQRHKSSVQTERHFHSR